MSSSSEVMRRVAGLAGFALALLLALPAARALSVHAVYRTACSRELGVILKVEKREIYMLRLDGKLVRIPRHEIVSLLYYPLSQLPIARVPAPPGFPPLRIKTRYRDQVVDLLSGWPIDYSENQVSFLLQNGKELVVDRASIWSLSFEAEPMAAASGTRTEQVVFVHPQTSGFCSERSPPAPSARPIFAQQILNDQIVIRRELDRLLEGYEQVLEYEQDQKFYPEPFLYRNRTMLGIWASAWSRYGASSTRSNNFTPLLVDELSLGPFRYQHLFLSGAAPNDMFLHHEAQSQLFYRFKAAYFHTSVFFDPNLLLVGTKYSWREEDFEDEVLDDRVSETLGIEFGFDWGPFAVELYPAVLGQAGVKIGENFFDVHSEHNLWRLGAKVVFPSWRVQVAAGLSSVEDIAEVEMPVDGQEQLVFFDTSWEFAYGRLNLGWLPRKDLDISLSGIARSTKYEATNLSQGAGRFAYDSLSLSTAVQASYALSHRFSVGGHAIVEMHRRDGSDLPERTRFMPRLGLFTGFWF
ncbi:MAG TPA: hypothetical protein VNO33_07400 [Kofleriaceae bacterium]|nr:hypothetical protein [Kofleriaceae bacterium]